MTQLPTYGPHNPHPLSTLRTELVWEGKYNEYGQRREVDIARCAMPMQKIESIDQPQRAATATGQLALFEQQKTQQDDFPHPLTPSPKLGEEEKADSASPLPERERGWG
jgi:adenine-specific DNA-methyltransferase